MIKSSSHHPIRSIRAAAQHIGSNTSITDRESFKIDSLGSANNLSDLEYLSGSIDREYDCWHVYSGITFASNVKVVLRILREFLEPVHPEVVIRLSDVGIIPSSARSASALKKFTGLFAKNYLWGQQGHNKRNLQELDCR